MSRAAQAGAPATAADVARLLRHRAVGAAMLAGEGLEIGALHYPLAAIEQGTVSYLDVDAAAALRARFPELAGESLVDPHWIGDVVQASVAAICGRRFDFIVMNHVLEHVANPIQALANVWDGLEEGGLLVLSVPDKDYTFDQGRALTSFAHLLGEFYAGVMTVDPGHYIELLKRTRPEVFEDRLRLVIALEDAAARREHAHVWDSDSFRRFWARSASLLGLTAHAVYESDGLANHFEYFGVLRKGMPSGIADTERMALNVLVALYRARSDLQRVFPASAPELAPRLLTWATTAGADVDSDAAALRAFQARYRQLRDGPAHQARRIEAIVRAGLSA